MQKVLQYLDKNRDRFLRELFTYIRFPSISAQPDHRSDLQQCGRWLQSHCRDIGLQTRLIQTKGNPILIASTPKSRKKKPRFLIYGHYDVQPPDPLDLWDSPPFEPTVKGHKLYGRGACDNKGQNFAHLKAVEAFLQTQTDLPCDVTFVIEGEEEVGSTHLAQFLKDHRSELRCEGVVISDTGMPSPTMPALTYGLRGVTALELLLQGPSRDLHSGVFGGSVENPAMALCQVLAQLRDRNGRIKVPGFYDDVRPLSRAERKQMARLPFTATAYRKLLGVPALFGEKNYTSIEQCAARPTLEINGLTSGYQGEGSKTIVPARASAKITCRLVPDQKPAQILRQLRRQIKTLCPPGVRLTMNSGHSGDPYLVSPTGPLPQAALQALRKAFGHEPVLLREGGSIPIVNDFKTILRVDTLLLGLALPDCNIHSPNEYFHLDCLEKGMRMSAHLWQELASSSN